MKIISVLFAVALAACASAEAAGPSSELLCPANTPSEVAPDVDTDLAFALDAQGVQRYGCSSNGTWVFIAPDADLFPVNSHPSDFVMHHFSGATWLYRDSSSIRAARRSGVTVDPASIQWLLLDVNHHDGAAGRMSDIVQVQRLSTAGGNAPAGTCDRPEADVNYTARYFFYRRSAVRHVRCGG